MKEIFFDNSSGSPQTAQWHAWRAAGIGASDAHVIAAAAGLCAKPSWAKSLYNLYLDKIGEGEEIKDNPAMKRGRDNEAAARAAFEEATGILLSPKFGEMDDHPFIRASFDGVDFFNTVIGEIKVPGAKSHEEALNGIIPDYYFVQITHQALVLWGKPDQWPADAQAYYISYRPEAGEDDKIAHVSINMDELAKMASLILPKHLEFWDCVTSRRPPVTAPASIEPIAAEYLRLTQEAQALDERIQALREQLLQAARAQPNGKLEGYGILAYETEVKGSIDYTKGLKALGVDPAALEAYRKPSTVRGYVKVVEQTKPDAANDGGAKTARRA
jgi:putative phage-type endonuclease